MIANLEQYPSKKKFAAKWTGELPAHWQVRRLKTVSEILNGATPSSSVPEYWNGEITWITPEDLGSLTGRHVMCSARRITLDGYHSSGTSMARAGSVAISTRAPIGHIGILTDDGCVNQGCKLLVPNESIDATYLFHVLDAGRTELKSLGRGTTFAELARGALGDFLLPIPSPEDQSAIVRFLDHADKHIHRYVRAKQRLIALLEEQKQAIIHQAVIGQIDVRSGQRYTTYKPSGLEWLKEVPAQWARRRLKTLLRSVDKRSLTGRETLLSLRRDHGVVAYADHFSRPSQGNSLVGYKLVYSGQLVVNRMQANNGLVFCSKIDGLVSPDYSVFEEKELLKMQFLSDLLRIPEYRAHFRKEATGLGTGNSGFLRLYDERFLDTIVFLPPREEQVAVLRYLSTSSRAIDRLKLVEQLAVERMEELRTRLVADVVTGKLDVRDSTTVLTKVVPLENR